MDDAVGRSKAGRLIVRNAVAGLCGVAAALAVVLPTLRISDFLPTWFPAGVVHVFPLPVACGLAVGFVSPRRAIVWAPLWSFIVAVLLIGLISGGAGAGPWRATAALVPTGVLAALFGAAGRRAAERGYVGRSVLALAVACCVTGVAGFAVLRSQERLFERDGKPQVLLEVDRDLIALSRGMDWSCDRQIASGGYVLKSRLNGQGIRLFVDADSSALRHIEFELPGGRADLRGKQAVRRYLKTLGVRDSLLVGLVDAHGCYRSVLRATRLTVWPGGRVLIDSAEPARSVD